MVTWTQELEERVVDLRVNHDMDWVTIRDLLGFDTKHQPRIRFSRLKTAGVLPDVPMGKYTYGEDAPAAPAEDGQELGYEIAAAFQPYDYQFDGEKFHFPVNGKLVSIPKETWETIVARYSTQGANETVYEVARTIGMHKKVLDACLRAYGHFKARPPVTREQLADVEETGSSKEPLYSRAIEVSEAKFSNALETKRIAYLERQVKEYREKQDSLKVQTADLTLLLADLKASGFGVPARVEVPELPPDAPVFHWPIFDLHLGLETKPEEGQWGHPYGTDIAIDLMLDQAVQVAQYVQSWGASVVHISLGGDLFHAFLGQTERGTFLNRDQSDRVVFRKALGMMRNIVDIITREGARVVIRSIPGNHDHLFAELFQELLAVAYEQDQCVLVENTLGRRGAFLVGETLHVIDHGRGFETFGPKAQGSAENMIRQVAGPDFYRAKQTVVYVGHTHHIEVKEMAEHLEFQRVPTLASSSKFEEALMLHSTSRGQLYRFDAKGRIEGTYRLHLPDTHVD